MTVRLPPERCKEIIELCQKLLKEKRITIRKFAKMIGKLVAAEPGIEYVPLYYKPLEKLKEEELKIHKGNFNSFMTIPSKIVPTIEWWINNISSSFKLISHGPPDMVLYSDSSTKAWGAFNKTQDIQTGVGGGVVSRRTNVSHQYYWSSKHVSLH